VDIQDQALRHPGVRAIRERYNDGCGEKIRYWMKREYGATIAVSTIYRILGEQYQLRSKCKKNQVRGLVPRAAKPREVIQHDTVNFGEVFAFTREAQVVVRPALEASDGAEALKQQMDYFQFSDMLQRDGGYKFKAEWNQTAQAYCNRIRTARPYRKNEQSYIESFNRTLGKECLGWLGIPEERPRGGSGQSRPISRFLQQPKAAFVPEFIESLRVLVAFAMRDRMPYS